MSEEILLSICIPSYNRFWSINRTLESIVKCKSDEFEVVILDNCSPMPIEESISVKDDRIHIFKRNAAVPGTNNIQDALLYGHGKYRMICLDKDMVLGEYLGDFLACLKAHPDLTGGFCKLNCKDLNMDNEYYSPKEMHEHVYRSSIAHPTGFFVRSDVISIEYERTKYDDRTSPYFANPYLFVLLLARAYSSGMGLYYKKPLVNNESLQEAVNTKSFSYSKKNDSLYFFPDKRIKQMDINFMHLNTLTVSKDVYDKTVLAVCFRAINEATYVYRTLMNDGIICEHYCIEKRYVNKSELEKYAQQVCDRILTTPYLTYSKDKRKKLAELTYFYGFELV